MAGKVPTNFPVILEKKDVEGKVVKRHAHSIIAYNQLITEGYKQSGTAPSRAAYGQKSKRSEKPADAPKTENK